MKTLLLTLFIFSAVTTVFAAPADYNCTKAPNACTDLAPTVILRPGNIAGLSALEVAIKVTEINGFDTDGSTITITIPADPRLLFVYDSTLTNIAGIQLVNNKWKFLGSNGVIQFWEYVGSGFLIPGHSASSFGFRALYDPQGTDGLTNITATIVPNSGGECNVSNNGDAERLVYFN